MIYVTTAQAGTLESMDCLVTVTEDPSGPKVSISGSGAARFKSSMERTVMETLKRLGILNVSVDVQDNGAIDLVLAARVEAAVLKHRTGGEEP